MNKAPVVSTGLSSSYYDIEIPGWLVQRIENRRVFDGQALIKTEELITVIFGNDFDFGNAFKSLVRAYACLNGGGKAGNSVEYDANKVIYSADKIKQQGERKNAGN